MRKILLVLLTGFALSSQAQESEKKMRDKPLPEKKIVVYQIFTRLFGNKNTTNKPWGTMYENGVGKFNDITDKALQEIKVLGATHIWYTGVPHHATISDYLRYGISNDDPDVVKGRAGSPYAVKDYYSVNPDLAENPSKSMDEFEALIGRTHKNGLKLIIDIVPNHVARKYEGKNNPKKVRDLGADDNRFVEYDKNNNFYYIPGQSFRVPDFRGRLPLNGEENKLSDGKFDENPAKWTGNGSRMAQPDVDDWYETVKVNYGVKPDGSKDFPELPEDFDTKDFKEHYEFWKTKEADLPSSWKKFRDIALFWIAKGVDGFRYDMAEMVPYEFWSFLNSAIKMKRADAFLLAEVYNPDEYRNYIHLGKMDYLYDKVELYDLLKDVIQNRGTTDEITDIQNRLADIEHHMLHFVENHDEQRIASPDFAGNAAKGKPMMVLSTTISTSPTMIYFGQEVGESGAETGGYGTPSRTSIFDYVGVPSHQRWMNEGAFDGGQLRREELQLRDFYGRLLNFSLESSALMGKFMEIQTANRSAATGYEKDLYSFVRWSDRQKLIIICNFSSVRPAYFTLKVPAAAIKEMGLADGSYVMRDRLYGKSTIKLNVLNGEGKAQINIATSESFIYEINTKGK